MGTSSQRCKDCGINISDLQPQCIRCKQCQKEHRKWLDRQFMRYKRQHKAAHRDTDLGTTDFSAHRVEDFNKEATAVKKEMKNLGLI